MDNNIKVILIDDDTDLGNLLNTGLQSLGYNVVFQNSLFGINNIIEEFDPNIMVLDVEIGTQNGIEEAKNILQYYPYIPIIFISSHREDEYIGKGLATGAVSYLKKPFDLLELDAYLKRFAQKNKQEGMINLGLYNLDLSNQQLIFKEEEIKPLSPMEVNVLLLLVRNKNRIVKREEFGKELWGKDPETVNEGTLNNIMSKLRQKVMKDPRLSITTIRHQGYRLNYKE